MNDKTVKDFCAKVKKELFENIIPFWIDRTQDNKNGGYYGKISNDLKIIADAPKSLILNSRILWTFAHLYQFKRESKFFHMAERAYHFLINHFWDHEMGGVYWLVDYKGNAIDNRKKIYGQAFTIYALAEYYRASGDRQVLEQAIKIYELIEKNNYDKENGGYFEASNRDWTLADDLRLSALDMNEKKSMNTHLHLMEAYTTLYSQWKDKNLKASLLKLIDNFIDHIISPESFHFILFQDELWRSKSDYVSFGHDIEGSWLLCEAAEVLGDPELNNRIKDIALKMVDKTLEEGFSHKYMIYAHRDEHGHVSRNLEWWQQAEAVVGLINAYQISNQVHYLEKAVKCWQVIEDKVVDNKFGEWYFGILPNGKPDQSKYKVSEWKGPYHNSRACMEILKRLNIQY